MSHPCRLRRLRHVLAQHRAITALIAAWTLYVRVSIAQPPEHDSASVVRPPDVLTHYRSVRLFDFNERPLGNYENTPMHWARLEGDGLPAYARGEFDDDVGHAAPPSFRLHVNGVGSNVCYEYRHSDLAVVPGTDYQIVAYVRCEGMRYSRAFVGAFMLDAAGRRIPGSENISPLISESGDWQRVQLALVGDFEDAASLCLQLWILQSHVWEDATRRPDAIIREDVNATAWFDDIVVYCLPRARLRLTNPGGVALQDSDSEVEIELSNISAEALEARLVIEDANGDQISTIDNNILSPDQPRKHIPLPELPPGIYHCRLYLSSHNESLLERSIQFAVVAPVPTITAGDNDVGVDIGRWSGTDLQGLESLTRLFGCRAARVAVLLGDDTAVANCGDENRDLSSLIRILVGNRIEPIGMLVERTANSQHVGPSASDPVDSTEYFEDGLGATLMQLGGSLATWQLGDQPIDSPRGSLWNAARRGVFRNYLSKHVTLPEMVLPVIDPKYDGDASAILSVTIPDFIPTRGLIPQLEFLTEASAVRRWLTLDAPRLPMSRETRLADLMRRFVLAKSMSPDRIFLPAAFEQSTASGCLAWQPKEEYIPYRTLIAYLAGRTAETVLHLDDDCIGIVFRDPSHTREGVMVAWTWRDRPLAEPLRAYLGASPVLIDLWGNRSQLEVDHGLSAVPLSPMPVLIDGVEAPIAHLAASYSITPDYLDPSESSNAPTIRFSNTFETTLTGRLEISGPPSWRIMPSTIEFSIQSGETLQHALNIETPPRQVATTEFVKVAVLIQSPTEARLDFETPLTVGLRDIQVKAVAHWDGPDLIIEQTLRNQSRQPVSFIGRCDAPLHSRMERTFMDVPPGEYRTQRYVVRDARDLAERRVRLGVNEVRGTRSLEQLVDIPK